MNKGLKKVFLNDEDITFVYSGRIVRSSLADASLKCRESLSDAPKNWKTGDKDISNLFLNPVPQV